MFRVLHVLTGLSALCATMGAIVTGLAQWSTETESVVKAYVADDVVLNEWAKDPVHLYTLMQPGVRLVNGLTIVVIITTLLVVFSTILSLLTESAATHNSSTPPSHSPSLNTFEQSKSNERL